MKPARFILNSDYCTRRNMSEDTITVQIPNNFTISNYQPTTLVRGSKIIGDPDDSYECFYEIQSYGYKTSGPRCRILPLSASGGDGVNPIALTAIVTKNGNNYTVEVTPNNVKDSGTYYFNNFSATLLAHIYTFKSPFSE